MKTIRVSKTFSMDSKYILEIDNAISNGLADNASDFVEQAIKKFLEYDKKVDNKKIKILGD